jgi:ATP-dependent exoDNAse (exonuclease V) beta subunit
MSDRPFVYTVIRASAGSGKTHRLTNRYLGLLASGVDPNAILATTFTRKAAGEILDRVLERLAKAAGDRQEAKELAREIQTDRDRPQDLIPLLRRLLQSLHRVRIGTLDSFYTALAGSFGLELGLPAGWSICEQLDEDALQREGLERLLERQPEEVRKLLPLLNRGENRRSVQEDLQAVIGDHLEIFRSSRPAAWEHLQGPRPVNVADRTAALERLRAYDFAACGNKNFLKAREDDIARFEQGDWQAFLGTGLAAKVAAGETTFYRKPIPEDARIIYETLVQHTRSEILRGLAEQNRATRNLLDRFNGELRTLKGATGQLRFGEVTQALVDGITEQALTVDGLAFRLDGAVEHLLLDEFQDTSFSQWRVLEPIAQQLTQAPAKARRSFFCVGDVKQAIYGWRGGMAEIFNTLESSLGRLDEKHLDESRRSAQPIIDIINKVFGNLAQFQEADKCQSGLAAWGKRFKRHTTHEKEIPGYVRLHTGPGQSKDQYLKAQRGEHCRYVAEEIGELFRQVQGRSIGVLCRSNDVVARMIYELRRPQLGIEASEEGGHALTDSAAVELILSLLTLADHPGHTVAWFHLQNSPLKEHLQTFVNADSLAEQMRRQLVANGYGRVTYDWVNRLRPACNMRDLSRLQQLLDMAYAFQARSTLRADDFVAWVREKRAPDPTGDNVRVMTIHAAKGLEFDVVVLPELDTRLTGLRPSFVVGRDQSTFDVKFVCRYVGQEVQQLLAPGERDAFDQDLRQRVEESLSLLYVAMTRAKHALHMFIPGPRQGRSDPKDAWYNLLRQTLVPNEEWVERSRLYQHGDADWYLHRKAQAAAQPAAAPRERVRITFRAEETQRPRGLHRVSPSQREGQGLVTLVRLFRPTEGTGTAAGTLYHKWFETIGWLEDGVPAEDVLRAAAATIRADLPAETWRELDKLIANFRDWLQNPVINGILCRSAYTHPQQPGFPKALAQFWTKSLAPQQVERERRFLIREATKLWNGSLDRLVWLGEGDRTIAADVIDFKTDVISPGDDAALVKRTEHYRPQIEVYRRAVARLGELPAERVAARLVFTCAGRVIDV